MWPSVFFLCSLYITPLDRLRISAVVQILYLPLFLAFYLDSNENPDTYDSKILEQFDFVT